MKVLGVVPARGGSKAIPRKNLADLGGRPLIGWTAVAALASRLERTVLSTDDPEIAEVGATYGLDVPFLRPAALASDDALAIDVVLHALDELEGDAYDAVMLLQPTTPLRTPDDIDAAIELLGRTGADSVISVTDVEGHHPARMKYLDGDRLVDPPFAEPIENMPRQQLEPLFLRNGAIYLTREATLRSRSFKGNDARGLVMPAERSVNIDTFFDLQIARAIVAVE